MYALSVKQPYAEAIARGVKTEEHRTWQARAVIGRDLLIVASKTPGYGAADLPRGVAVCIVRVEGIEPLGDGFAWHLSAPRRVDPTPIRGSAALYHVADERITVLGRAAPSAPSSARRLRAAPSAPRVRRKVGPREKVGPYTFEVDDRKVAGEAEATPAAARKRAARLAAARGTTIAILRDGFTIAFVEPS